MEHAIYISDQEAYIKDHNGMEIYIYHSATRISCLTIIFLKNYWQDPFIEFFL